MKHLSVQTTTDVKWNPLAISMVTTKPTVQRLCLCVCWGGSGGGGGLTASVSTEDGARDDETKAASTLLSGFLFFFSFLETLIYNSVPVIYDSLVTLSC